MNIQQCRQELMALTNSLRRLGLTELSDAIEDNKGIKACIKECKAECRRISHSVVNSHLVSETRFH